MESPKIKDGIINPAKWDSDSSPRIVFLLKEAHTLDPAFNDLTRFLRSQACVDTKSHLWRNSGAWAHLIMHPEHKGEIKREAIWEALQYCAVVNIKKSDGKVKSQHSELQDYINRKGENIRKEILALKPQVIIAGGTFRYLEQLFSINVPLSGKTHVAGTGMDFYEYQEGAQRFLIMRVRHPAYTKATGKEYFDRLKTSYKRFYPKVKGIWS